jgi:3-hydroxybutyryl-CoA dehydratase
MENDSPVLLFDEVSVGDEWTSAKRVVTEADIADFAVLTGDHDPLHTDPEFAQESPYGGVIAHGLMGLSFLAGLSSDAPRMQNFALMEVSEWRFRNPLYPGDQVWVTNRVLEKSERSKRYGEILWYRALYNQESRLIQDGKLRTLVARTARNLPRFDPAQVGVVGSPPPVKIISGRVSGALTPRSQL